MIEIEFTEKQIADFIEWMNYTDHDSFPVYRNLNDVIETNGIEMTEDLLEEFFEYLIR